jgi:hypothetical protein
MHTCTHLQIKVTTTYQIYQVLKMLLIRLSPVSNLLIGMICVEIGLQMISHASVRVVVGHDENRQLSKHLHHFRNGERNVLVVLARPMEPNGFDIGVPFFVELFLTSKSSISTHHQIQRGSFSCHSCCVISVFFVNWRQLLKHNPLGCRWRRWS